MHVVHRSVRNVVQLTRTPVNGDIAYNGACGASLFVWSCCNRWMVEVEQVEMKLSIPFELTACEHDVLKLHSIVAEILWANGL
jgi:hypothetical protein